MNEDLREQLIRAMHVEYKRQFNKPMFPPYAEAAVNAVMDQLEIAGYSVIRMDALDWLQTAAWDASWAANNPPPDVEGIK